MADDENRSEGEAAGNPFAMPDFSKLMEQMQMPGVDFEQVMQQGQKNIESLQAANQAVAEGWQTLAQRQMEIFQETMEQWQSGMSEMASGSPTESMEGQSQLAREGFEKALANMQELAEIASESQRKAFDIMRERIEDNMKNMFGGRSNDSDD